MQAIGILQAWVWECVVRGSGTAYVHRSCCANFFSFFELWKTNHQTFYQQSQSYKDILNVKCSIYLYVIDCHVFCIIGQY